MSDPREMPEEIAPTDDGKRLRIVWKDGKECEYTPRFLRLKCPCAGCVEEMTGKRILTPAMVPEDVYPMEINYVGNYALRFHWSDGHQTGIYPYEYLRELCEQQA